MGDVERISDVGTLAMRFMDELREILPDGARVEGVGIAVEIAYECENCGETHDPVLTLVNVPGGVYKRGLFSEAVDAHDAQEYARILEMPEED